ncbi:hypothetical protein Sjap_025405 [Stephania japonica]|uniref:Uncharacterized protein n=1 Tax=Stephania japonica TaxID=461633 RepID=A0AAP0E1N3_9MAGN
MRTGRSPSEGVLSASKSIVAASPVPERACSAVVEPDQEASRHINEGMLFIRGTCMHIVFDSCYVDPRLLCV